jgi:hypothetical protein
LKVNMFFRARRTPVRDVYNAMGLRVGAGIYCRPDGVMRVTNILSRMAAGLMRKHTTRTRACTAFAIL